MVEIMSGSRNDWFPTPVWHFTVDNHQELNTVLLQEIEEEQQRDRQGEKWSNMLGWHRSILYINAIASMNSPKLSTTTPSKSLIFYAGISKKYH